MTPDETNPYNPKNIFIERGGNDSAIIIIRRVRHLLNVPGVVFVRLYRRLQMSVAQCANVRPRRGLGYYKVGRLSVA